MTTRPKNVSKITMKAYFEDGTTDEITVQELEKTGGKITWAPIPSETRSYTFPEEQQQYIYPSPYPQEYSWWWWNEWRVWAQNERMIQLLEEILKELKQLGCRKEESDLGKSEELPSKDYPSFTRP